MTAKTLTPSPARRRHGAGSAAGMAAWPSRQAEPQPKLPTEPLTIETADGPLTFEVEMAVTPMQQSRGLMFRDEVPPLTGMLFVHSPPRPISMWMRNTPTSLDMLFINDEGVIAGIAERTTPFSEAVISSPGPMAGVLEILGGEAERLGISAGRHGRPPVLRR